MSSNHDPDPQEQDQNQAQEDEAEAEIGAESEVEDDSEKSIDGADTTNDADTEADSDETASDGVEPEAEVEKEQEEAVDEDAIPEPTGPPAQFQAAIQGGTIKTVANTLGAIVDETRIHIDENGIQMRAVDPANVAMDDLELDVAAFESYDATAGVIGVDLERFVDIVKMANKGDLVQLSLDQETRKLSIHIDGIEFTMACLDPQTIRTEPEIPDLELPAEATIERDVLDRGVKAADMVSDHVYVRMDAASERVFVEADGDTDEVSLEIADDELEGVTAADAESLFSLDYLKDLVRTIPKDAAVTMRFGTDFPLIMAYEIDDGDGHVTRMLAPRIQSD